MVSVQRIYGKANIFTIPISLRWYSQSITKRDIKKSVFISQSKDIYTNLALEDWIYRNVDFKNRHILMLWQNEPCIVIGRHQNPWLEANISELPNITEQGVKFARRNSGGGAVFHDLGNLNLTFFTPREHYNRRYNLEIITRAVFNKFGVKVDISPREDLILHGYKVSGTASKLGRPNAYHHCTLLVNSNKVHLSHALQKRGADIKTNATKSIKSKIMNLCEENPDISVTKLIQAIGWEYMRTPAFASVDEDKELAISPEEFKTVDPTDIWFPGLGEIREHYASWDWRYGKTPKFTILRSFAVPDNLLHHFGKIGDLKVTVTVEQCKIRDINFSDTALFISTEENNGSITNIIDQKFSEETLNSLEMLLHDFIDDKGRFITECLKEIIASV